MIKKFTKKVENFVCENCGFDVVGNGYTNHCPKCLFSKDVDINPGDRLATCNGLMEPISIETKRDDYIIVHRCKKCGKIRKNKSSEFDDFNEIIKVMKKDLNKFV